MAALTQPFTSTNQWYALDYPRMWEVEIIDNIPAFFDPLFGKGALQVFAVKLGDVESLPENFKDYPFLVANTLPEKLSLFLKEQHNSLVPEEITIFNRDEIEFVAHEYQHEERFYMICMLQKNNTFMLMLYNCTEQPEKEEAENISSIIKSVRILD